MPEARYMACGPQSGTPGAHPAHIPTASARRCPRRRHSPDRTLSPPPPHDAGITGAGPGKQEAGRAPCPNLSSPRPDPTRPLSRRREQQCRPAPALAVCPGAGLRRPCYAAARRTTSCTERPNAPCPAPHPRSLPPCPTAAHPAAARSSPALRCRATRTACPESASASWRPSGCHPPQSKRQIPGAGSAWP